MQSFRHYSIDRVYQYILTIGSQGAMNADLQAKIEAKRVKLQDDAIYVRYAGTFTGVKELLPNSQGYSRGTTNLFDRKLSRNTVFFVDSIYVGHASTADPDASTAYTTLITNVPSTVVNGHLRITQNNADVISLPLCGFFSNAAPQALKRDQAVPLTDIRHLDDQREIGFFVDCAENGVTPAGSDGIEVVLYGSSTQEKLW